MASEWEMAMGVELGMGMGTYHHNASSVTTAPMSSHHGVGAGYSSAHHHHHYYGMPPMGDATAMRVDDLLENLDLSTGAGAHEFFPTAAAAAAKGHHHSGAAMVGEPSPTANSSDHQTSLLSFADEFYIPSEEAAELEWLSKFVDDSYSDMPNYSSAAHAAMAAAAAAANAAGNGAGGTSAGQDSCAAAAPGRGARSKRSSRAAAAAWHSLVPRPPSQPSPSSSCSSSDLPSSTNNKPARPNNNGGGSRGRKSPGPGGPAGEVAVGVEGGVRRCTHCASETTPQWRTGPLGPKTLCNACGVRFKSGRLVPEYRPASSPTFVLTQHSNSHRKVMELRRQKELVLIRGSHRDAAAASAAAAAAGSAGAPRPELMFRDYGVC